MADDPWAQYLAPPSSSSSSAADPWAQFTKPPSAGGAPAPNSSSGPPAASAEPGGDWIPGSAWLHHMGRVFDDALTFGGADYLGNLPGTGTNVAAERAKTQAASQAVGPIASTAADLAGYGMGAGELGLGEKVAAKLGGGWLAGIGGAAAEGAGSGALGAAGHGENVGAGATLGGLGGAVGGALGGVAGRGGALAPAVDLATLEANKTGAYQNLGGVLYDNADVRQAATNAINEITQREPRIARNGQGALDALNEIGNTHAIGPGAQSGEDINDFIRSFKKVNTGDSVDEAGQIAQKHFNGLLDNTQPIAAGNQVPGQVGAGRTALTDANAAYGRLKDAQALQGWENKAASGGPDVGSQAQSFLNSVKGQKLAAQPDWANQLEALKTLGATARPTQSTVVPSLWDVKHAVRPMIEYGIGAGVTGAGTDYATTGHIDPTHVATEALAGVLGGYGLHAGYPAIQGRLQQAAQNRAIAAARVALSTGAQQAPVLPAAPVRDALRSLIYSRGAAGGY